MDSTRPKPTAATVARWTFSSLAAVPDVETGTPTGAHNNNGGSIIGFILLFDVLIRCFSSFAYALNLPPIVVAPCVCILVVGMIVVVVVAVSNAS